MVNENKIKKTFLSLVKIDSPSGEEEKVADFILRYLQELSIEFVRDKYGNVIAKVPGSGKSLMLSAHMDTVEPGRGIKAIVDGDEIRSDGKTILGADDKAGIVAILEAVAYLRKNKISHRSLELVFTREEEIGCLGARNLDYKNIKSKEGICIDSCRPLGYITMASPFIYAIDIEVTGKSAHAGSFPEKGINAIHAAASAIADIKVGRINSSTTNNIGIINGGTAVNSVPDSVVVKAEARSHNIKSAQAQIDLMNKAFKKHIRRHRAKLNFKSKLLCYGFAYLKSDPLIKKIFKTNLLLGLKTVYGKSGGATDANIFVERGIKVVDISYGGKGPHTKSESIKISELKKLTEFLIDFVK